MDEKLTTLTNLNFDSFPAETFNGLFSRLFTTITCHQSDFPAARFRRSVFRLFLCSARGTPSLSTGFTSIADLRILRALS